MLNLEIVHFWTCFGYTFYSTNLFSSIHQFSLNCFIQPNRSKPKQTVIFLFKIVFHRFDSHKMYTMYTVSCIVSQNVQNYFYSSKRVNPHAFYACYCFHFVCTKALRKFRLGWSAAREFRPRRLSPLRWRRSCPRAAPCSAGELSWSTSGPPELCREPLERPETIGKRFGLFRVQKCFKFVLSFIG